MSDDDHTPDHREALRARTAATQAILDDPSHTKVVVAGPGTGKTHLFKEIFASKGGGDKLTLTFITALVDDLSLELHGTSAVKTLHGYALGQLPKDKVRIFPQMPEIIRGDGNILLGEDISFEHKIYEVDNSEGYLDFYSTRRRYYDFFGYADVILGLVRIFEKNPDRIPTYAQIVVDEYQDFNELEVSLIELLSSKSPIVIVGDDDQALYDFKRAHPKYIRSLHSHDRSEYASFSLPYCSRSTRVIVDAVNDMVLAASKAGFLEARVDKPYRYFSSPEKDRESADEPHLIHKRLEDAQIAWFISKEMNEIAKKLRKKFEVLVISPYGSQAERVGRALEKKGFMKITYQNTEERGVTYLDGLRLLINARRDEHANLGWRIAGQCKMSDAAFADILKVSTGDSPPPLKDLVPEDVSDQIKRDVKFMKRVRDKKEVSTEEIDTLFARLELDHDEVRTDHLRRELAIGEFRSAEYPSVKKIPVTATTARRSKGLAADYVFITHFDERYIPGCDGITDQQICNILVALTRARKKVWLLSTTDESSVFLRWIDADRIRAE